jgi:hypothetical protein
VIDMVLLTKSRSCSTTRLIWPMVLSLFVGPAPALVS